VVIKALKDSTLPQIQARNHTFVEHIEEKLPPVWADFYRLQQVLTNLVSNAYKYTPDGGTITLDVKRCDNRVQFSVADTGIGLAEEEVQNLGTKFWRANNEHTLLQPGTGLGFSITRSLVEQMGSKIKIESAPGEGSRFTFDVAVAPDPNEPSK
jgi:cell cycle sensor histidine kinase DivJ